MAFARRHLNLTVLPTGEVLATGGVGRHHLQRPDPGPRGGDVEPRHGTSGPPWRAAAITRGYHATSLLLPDGRVLHAGSGDGAGARSGTRSCSRRPICSEERGPRSRARRRSGYGAQFRLLTPQAGEITQVSLIRLGATTHAFDENQRFQRLTFTADATDSR